MHTCIKWTPDTDLREMFTPDTDFCKMFPANPVFARQHLEITYMLMLHKRTASLVYPCKRKHVEDFISELSTSYSNSKNLKSPVPSPVFRRLAEIQHLGGDQAWPLCAVFRRCKSPSSSSQKSVIKHCERKVQDQLHACTCCSKKKETLNL